MRVPRPGRPRTAATPDGERDPLTELGLEGLRELPADWGLFSTESLHVRYRFGLDELAQGLTAMAAGAGLPETVRTAVHESMHLFHNTTTPFGFYVHALRRAQTTLVLQAVRDLRSHGVRIRYPLVALLQTLPAAARELCEDRLARWYAIELLVLLLFGERDLLTRQMLGNPLLRGRRSVTTIFRMANDLLASHYAANAAALEQAGVVRTGGGGGVPGMGLGEVSDDDERLEAMLVVLTYTGPQFDTTAVLESAALAAEHFGRQQDGAAALATQVAGPASPERQVYTNLVSLALQAVPRGEPGEFVATYLTLCELALYPPVLPHHHALRTTTSLEPLLPYLRMRSLLSIARELTPVRDADAATRYAAEACDRLGWPTPAQIVETTVASHAPMPGDIRESLYVRAQAYRRQAPWLFLSPLSHIAATARGQAPAWVSEYHFPVISYADRTTFHVDKPFVVGIVLDHLFRRLVRRLLLRRDLAVAAPFPMTDDVRAYFERELAAQLGELLAMQIRGVRIV